MMAGGSGWSTGNMPGVGHPLFDLANASANAALSEDQEIALLSAYRETAVADPRDLAELRIFKTVSLLREALWAVIQSMASDIDFDYGGYARANFEAYRTARVRLDSEPGTPVGLTS